MNMILEKLSFLILSLSLVTGLPVEPNLELMAAIDGSEVHHREVRSLTDELGWHLDRIDQRSLPLDGQYSPLATGSGVDIYMFGEGINLDHEEFEGRAFDGGYRWLRNPKDCSRKLHGTQVASLAVGKSVGVATKANVYSIKVLNCQLTGYFSDVIRGIHYVINATKLTGRRSVIALPLIGTYTLAVNDVIEEAVRENIVLVAAAGNFLQDSCNYSPASSPHVITVGGTEKDDRLLAGSAGSNYGKCVTLYAPARSILAAAAGNNGYRELSGTSSSCGIVAGVAALVFEKFPHYTPQQVKEYLIDQSTPRVVQTSSRRYKVKPNRFLYVGEEESDFDGSGALGVVFE